MYAEWDTTFNRQATRGMQRFVCRQKKKRKICVFSDYGQEILSLWTSEINLLVLVAVVIVIIFVVFCFIEPLRVIIISIGTATRTALPTNLQEWLTSFANFSANLFIDVLFADVGSPLFDDLLI